MSEVNANINIGIDSSQALASLRTLQNQISSFNKSIIAGNAQAMSAQKSALSGLTAQIGATKAFSTSIVNVESSVSRLGNAIDKNKLGLGEYFRYGVASSKNFGKVFAKEHTQMTALATERVKRLQTQYIALGAAQNGVTRAMAVRPLALFNADTAIAAQRQQLFSKLLSDGSTSLINFGKNTQWAGRQLMVGFTVPLTIFGGMAGKIFMDLERQVVNFRRVYGDAMTPAGETDQMVKEIQDLGKEFTKYGIAVKDTMGLAGDIAATGAQGADLVSATAQSTRLATLGMIEMDQAMTATISLQTAFKLSNEELAQSVNFLNAVENQTILSLGDVTEAIPKVAPVIMGLGGNVEDLAYFLTAMREGGVNAAEGANALKSGLASLINPTKGAREQLEKVGIDIDSIISTNKGDIRATVQEFGSALMTLDKFGRQQTLAKVFGKYQFARLGSLFENISTEGSQASRVIDLAGQSIEDLAGLADKELGAIEESIGMKFTGALERLKLAIAPIGEMFLKIATPILEVVSKILDRFNDLSPGIKQFITILVAGVGVVVPTVIMLIGLFANFMGQAIKGFAAFNNLFNRLRGGGKDLSYLAGEQLDATAASASLEGQTTSLTAALNVQRSAVGQLSRAYGTYAAAARNAASGLPQGFVGRPAKGMATGGFVGGSGNKDSEPAMLMPGEFVVNKKAAQQNSALLSAMNQGTLKGYAKGTPPIPQSRAAAVEYAHIADRVELTLKQITSLLSKMGTAASGAKTTLEQGASRLKSGDSNSGVFGYNNLGVPLRGDVNSRMGDRSAPGGAPKAEFLSALKSSGSGSAAGIIDIFQQRGVISPEQSKQFGEAFYKEFSSEMAKLPLEVVRDADMTAAFNKAVKKAADNIGKEFSDTAMKIIREEEAAITSIVDKEGQGHGAGGRKPIPSKISGATTSYRSRGIKRRGIFSSLGGVRPGLESEIAEASAIGSGVSSPSKITEQQGKDIAKGMEIGIEKGTPGVVEAAKNMGKKAVSSSESAGNRGRRSSSRPQGPANISSSELRSQQAEEARLQRQSQRGSRGRAFREGTISPLALRAGEESTRIANIGNAQKLAMQEEVNRSHDLAIAENKKLTEQTSEVSKEMSKSKGYAKKFGGALKGGSMKLTGAMFAMDGVVFAASMMNNSMGEFAQKIMPAVFAVQGFAMMMPMLMAVLSNPIGLAALAIAAVGVGFWILDNKRKDLQKEIIDTSVAMNGSSRAFDDLSKELGSMKPSEKFSSLFSGMSGTKKEEEALTEGQQFLETESGKAMVSRSKLLSGKNRKSAIENELLQSIALDIITPDQARGIARAMALALKDPILGASVVGSIYSYVKKNKGQVVKPIQDLVSSVQKDIGASLAPYDEYIKKEKEYGILLEKNNKRKSLGSSGKRVTSEEYNAAYMTEEETKRLKELQKEMTQAAPKMVTKTIGPVIDSSKKLAEAQSYLNLQYREGNLDREEYLKLTNDIQKSQDLLAQSLQRMQLQTTDVSFSENLKMAALAIGMTEEEFGNMETQARSLESVLINTLGKDASWAKQASNTLQLAMTSGALGASEAGSTLELLSNKKYSAVLELALEGDDPAILADTVKTLNQIETLPQTIMQEVITNYNSKDFSSPAEFNAWAQEMLTNVSYFANNPKLQLEAFVSLNDGETTTKEMKNVELFINKINNNSKISSEIDFSMVNLKSLSKANEQWDSLGKKKNISKIIKMEDGFSNIAKRFGATLSQLDALPDVFKQAILLEMNVVADLKVNMGNFQSTIDDQASSPRAKMAARRGMRSTQRMIQNQVKQLKGLFNLGKDTKNPIPDPDPEGGGSDTKSFLEDLVAETEANLQMFPKMLDRIKKKFPAIPQQIIEAIGGGEEGMKKAQELLNANKKKVKELLAKYRKATIAETLQGMQDEVKAKKRSNRAGSILEAQGFSPEDAKDLASNTDYVFTLLEAKAGRGGKSVKEVVAAFKELIAVTKEAKDPVDELNKAWSEYSNAVDMAFDVENTRVENEFAEKRYGAEQKTTKEIQEQIDLNEGLIQIQQDLIDGKQEEIDDYERINDLTSQNIDDLQRQDELRNRVSDALSHELDLMGQQEAKISEAYDKRISSLDKVQELNNRILQQQRDQLGVSQALSEGDIYAATAAAQAMRQNQAKDAQDQARKGLEQGRDNAIDSLRTSEGLTREEAERQIAAIKEQSYQASLMIRMEEDKIYANSLEVRRLTNEIYNINEDMIEPLTNQNNQHSRILENHQKALDLALSILKVGGLTADEFQRQKDENAELVASIAANITEVNKYKKAWDDVATAARNAIAISGTIPASAADNSRWSVVGGRPVFSNAGGMIPGYAAGGLLRYTSSEPPPGMMAGGVAGNGSRDSVAARLTPGEFVIRKSMVDKYGMPMLSALNQGSFSMPSYKTQENPAGKVNVESNNSTNISAPMYNSYSVGVNVSNAGASADEIANITIAKIKQMQGTQIRSGRGY